MGKLKQALRTAWRLIKISALIALAATILTLAYFVIHAWIGYGIYLIILGLAGAATIVIGSLILINQSEKNLEYDNQANLQRWVMAHTAQSPQPRTNPRTHRPTSGSDRLERLENRRRQQLRRRPVPQRPTRLDRDPQRKRPTLLWPDNYDGQMAAWNVALDSAPTRTHRRRSVNAGSTGSCTDPSPFVKPQKLPPSCNGSKTSPFIK